MFEFLFGKKKNQETEQETDARVSEDEVKEEVTDTEEPEAEVHKETGDETGSEIEAEIRKDTESNIEAEIKEDIESKTNSHILEEEKTEVEEKEKLFEPIFRDMDGMSELDTDSDASASEEKLGLFQRLKKGLAKTRDSISGNLDNLFTASEIDDDFYDEIEEILVMSDTGMSSTEEIIEELKNAVRERHVKKTEDCRNLLKDVMTDILTKTEPEYLYEEKTSVILMVGVNGAGKTTTVGKLASQLKSLGRKTMIVAADTFRAAAFDQLKVWADRAGVDFIKCTEGQDPASVVFDGVKAAKSRRSDVVICDTAGRLNNKKNLMNELEKINRVVTREYPEAHIETLIVLDGTTGQNAISQARDFMDVCQVTGAVITKLDGTAKGGIAFAIQNELNIPIKYIGVGEAIEDLQKFDARAFVEALFSKSEEDTENVDA